LTLVYFLFLAYSSFSTTTFSIKSNSDSNEDNEDKDDWDWNSFFKKSSNSIPDNNEDEDEGNEDEDKGEDEEEDAYHPGRKKQARILELAALECKIFSKSLSLEHWKLQVNITKQRFAARPDDFDEDPRRLWQMNPQELDELATAIWLNQKFFKNRQWGFYVEIDALGTRYGDAKHAKTLGKREEEREEEHDYDFSEEYDDEEAQEAHFVSEPRTVGWYLDICLKWEGICLHENPQTARQARIRRQRSCKIVPACVGIKTPCVPLALLIQRYLRRDHVHFVSAAVNPIARPHDLVSLNRIFRSRYSMCSLRSMFSHNLVDN
jgi:hypothetical protein